jgi:hypothetical protein
LLVELLLPPTLSSDVSKFKLPANGSDIRIEWVHWLASICEGVCEGRGCSGIMGVQHVQEQLFTGSLDALGPLAFLFPPFL